MIFSKWHIVGGCVLVVLLIHACKKDAKETAPSTTPYVWSLPAYVPDSIGAMPVPAHNPLTEEGVRLGRMLFYEKMLSKDQTLSCGSCHRQENGFSDPNQFSIGVGGLQGTRNAMPLANLGWNAQFFWDGRRAGLEAQAHDPVVDAREMAATWAEVVRRLQTSGKYPDLFFAAFGTRTIDSNLAMQAIAQFERTLVSFGSRFDRYYYEKDTAVFSEQERRGFTLFTGKGHCASCHTPGSMFTDATLRNNGLDQNHQDPGLMAFTGQLTDRGKFKTPSLRNIARTAPYMHDGRFRTLAEVVEFYSNQVQTASPNIDEKMIAFGHAGVNFTRTEAADIVAFLHTLTDETYLTSEKFADPNPQ